VPLQILIANLLVHWEWDDTALNVLLEGHGWGGVALNMGCQFSLYARVTLNMTIRGGIGKV